MGLWGGEKLVVGYDLGNEFSQISVAASGSGDVTTLSQTAGEENFNIPTVLCKRIGVNQCFMERKQSAGERKDREFWWTVCWSWPETESL